MGSVTGMYDLESEHTEGNNQIIIAVTVTIPSGTLASNQKIIVVLECSPLSIPSLVTKIGGLDRLIFADWSSFHFHFPRTDFSFYIHIKTVRNGQNMVKRGSERRGRSTGDLVNSDCGVGRLCCAVLLPPLQLRPRIICLVHRLPSLSPITLHSLQTFNIDCC